MELITGTRKPLSQNPKIQIIYSVPKAGKTTVVSLLPNHLIAELETNGAGYVEGRIQDISKPSEFDEFLIAIKNSKDKVADYLIVDTISKLDEWSEIVGTYNYMKKPQGRTFNREEGKPDGRVILHTDPRFETVHELGQGYGYQHSRTAMTEWYDKLIELINLGKIEYIILLAHVRDKMIETKNGDTVEHIEINLTGKVKSIYSSRVDAVGHLKRIDNKCYISYGGDEKIVAGGRCAHLTGEILVSERTSEGKIISHWNNIYLK